MEFCPETTDRDRETAGRRHGGALHAISAGEVFSREKRSLPVGGARSARGAFRLPDPDGRPAGRSALRISERGDLRGAGGGRAAGRGRPVADAGEELCEHPFQLPCPDQHPKREKSPACVDVLDRQRPRPRGGSSRRGRDDVHRHSVSELPLRSRPERSPGRRPSGFTSRRS